jgi:hypothetical protein
VQVLDGTTPVAGDDCNQGTNVIIKKYSVVTAASYTRSSGSISITFASTPSGQVSVKSDTGAWGSGTGLLDEDGTCPSKSGSICWIPGGCVEAWRDFTACNANQQITATFKTDMNDFLAEISENWYTQKHNAVEAGDPPSGGTSRIFIAGTYDFGNWGGIVRSHMLQGAGAALVGTSTILAFCDAFPRCINCGDTQAAIDYVHNNLGANLPWTQWSGFTSPDSPMGNGADTVREKFSTQALRGQGYYDMIQANLANGDTASGTKHVVGQQWWEEVDNTGEDMNWGILTQLDNLYNGTDAVIATGTDQWGCATGGQSGNYGDFMTKGTQGNNLWLAGGGPPSTPTIPSRRMP